MDDKAKIQILGEMVEATERVSKPWRIALIITNIIWAIVFATFLLLAYLSPETSVQYQDNKAYTQYQTTGSEAPSPEITYKGD